MKKNLENTEIFGKNDFFRFKDKLVEKIKNGAVFIYPTDTIYGIGCDATNAEAVLRLRKIKNSFTKPLSVIVPSNDWMLENCEIPKFAKDWLAKLPGPYTLIFKLKKKFALAPAVNPADESVGCRIPKHWFTEIVQGLGIPIITTSANISGRPFMTCLEDLAPSIKACVDFIIFEGDIDGTASTVVNLSGEKEDIIRRHQSS